LLKGRRRGAPTALVKRAGRNAVSAHLQVSLSFSRNS
jgi:hypothetical protein